MALPTTTMPDVIRPASYDIRRHTNVLSSTPIVGAHKTQTRAIGEAWHTIKLTYDPMHRDDFAELVSFCNARFGSNDTFGIYVPNFTKTKQGLERGNYLSLSSGKFAQLDSPGSADNTQLYSFKTTASNQTFSNQIAVTTGVPVAVYFEASGVTSTSTVQLWTANTGTTGSTASDVFPVTNGRNLVMLTPTTSVGVYVKVTGSTTTVSDMSIKTGVDIGSNTATFAPRLLAADDSSYILPAPAALIPVSLSSNVQEVSYGRDSFIRLTLDLIERR